MKTEEEVVLRSLSARLLEDEAGPALEEGASLIAVAKRLGSSSGRSLPDTLTACPGGSVPAFHGRKGEALGGRLETGANSRLR